MKYCVLCAPGLVSDQVDSRLVLSLINVDSRPVLSLIKLIRARLSAYLQIISRSVVVRKELSSRDFENCHKKMRITRIKNRFDPLYKAETSLGYRDVLFNVEVSRSSRWAAVVSFGKCDLFLSVYSLISIDICLSQATRCFNAQSCHRAPKCY